MCPATARSQWLTLLCFAASSAVDRRCESAASFSPSPTPTSESNVASRLAAASNAYNDEGEVHRVRAEILVALGDLDAAEASYHAALEAAERRNAGLWRLRSAMGLARLLDQRGRRPQARAQLLEAWERVSEGFDTPDATEAKALLDKLL